MSETKPTGPNPSTVAWGKVHGYADKLFDALEALDEAGGLRAAAEAGGWSPKTMTKALATLEATRAALEAQIGSRRSDRVVRNRLVGPRPRTAV